VKCFLHPQIKIHPARQLQGTHRQNRIGEITQNVSTIFCGDVLKSYNCQTQPAMLHKFIARIREKPVQAISQAATASSQ
jgi:hypothetical protein